MSNKKKFTLHQIQQMGQEFRAGASLVEISNRWGIPYRTLQDHKKRNFYTAETADTKLLDDPHASEPTLAISSLRVDELLVEWEKAIKVFILFVEHLQIEAEAGRFDRGDINVMAESVMHFKWAIEDIRKTGCFIPDTLMGLQGQAYEMTSLVQLMRKKHEHDLRVNMKPHELVAELFTERLTSGKLSG